MAKSRKKMNIIPKKDENMKIFTQVLEDNRGQDPKNLSVMFFRAWSDQIILNTLNQFEDDYKRIYERFENEYEKAVKDFKDGLISMLDTHCSKK